MDNDFNLTEELMRILEEYESDAIDMLSFVDNASNAACSYLYDKITVDLDVVDNKDEYKRCKKALELNNVVAFRVRHMIKRYDLAIRQLINKTIDDEERRQDFEIRSRLL